MDSSARLAPMTWELNKETEFSGVYVAHWEVPRFEWDTGRRLWFGLKDEKVNCQLEFPEGMPDPFLETIGGQLPANWRSHPGLRWHVRLRGALIEKGHFGHRGWCSFRLKVSKVLDLSQA